MACTGIEIVYSDYTLPILNIVATISSSFLIYLYIKAYLKKELKSTSLLFYLGLALFVSIFISFIIAIIRNRIYCHTDFYYLINFFDMANGVLYNVQCTILVTVLFIRLVDIFNDTSLALSRCVIYLFNTLIVAVVILGSSCSISYNMLEEYSPNSSLLVPIDSLWAFLSLVYVMVLIWLNGMFVYKMYKVYHMTQGTHSNTRHKMKDVITKTTVLCIVSSLTILLFLITFFALSASDSPHMFFASNIAIIADSYTNFLSIFLSYECFDGYYVKLYACCDYLGRRYIGGETQDIRAIDRQLTASSPTSSHATATPSI